MNKEHCCPKCVGAYKDADLDNGICRDNSCACHSMTNKTVEGIISEFRYKLEGSNVAKDGGAVATKYVQPVSIWLRTEITALLEQLIGEVEAHKNTGDSIHSDVLVSVDSIISLIKSRITS